MPYNTKFLKHDMLAFYLAASRTAEVPADTSVNSFLGCWVHLERLISTIQKIKEEARM